MQNKLFLRSSHQDAFFNTAVLHLWRNSFKNTCDGMQFLVNLHTTLSNSEPLLQKFKYFTTALVNEQLLLQSSSRKLLLDSEKLERFSIQKTNLILAGNNFTENFTANVLVGIFETYKTIPQLFLLFPLVFLNFKLSCIFAVL